MLGLVVEIIRSNPLILQMRKVRPRKGDHLTQSQKLVFNNLKKNKNRKPVKLSEIFRTMEVKEGLGEGGSKRGTEGQ